MEYWLFSCIEVVDICRCFYFFQPFANRQILHFFKLKEFADDNFKFGEKYSTRIESIGRRNCWIREFSSFPTVFSKDLYCRHVKTRACLGKGSIVWNMKS